MAIIKQFDKRSGITYIFDRKSYRVLETELKDKVSRLLGENAIMTEHLKQISKLNWENMQLKALMGHPVKYAVE